jgi:hypothetical protein
MTLHDPPNRIDTDSPLMVSRLTVADIDTDSSLMVSQLTVADMDTDSPLMVSRLTVADQIGRAVVNV